MKNLFKSWMDMNGSNALEVTFEGPMEPTLGTPDSSCFDLYVLEDVEFEPFEKKVIDFEVKLSLPPGWHALLFARSSTGNKNNFFFVNGVGVIDNDYRGNIKGCFMNLGIEPAKMSQGERYLQLMILPKHDIQLVRGVVKDSGRGGFGSTGQ